MKPEVQCLLEYYTDGEFWNDAEKLEHSNESDVQFQTARVESGTLHEDEHIERFMVHEQAGIHAPFNVQQRRHIRNITRNLRTIADSLRIRPSRAHVAAEQVIIQNESLDESEMQVVNNIYSITSVTTVSRVASYLEEKLTSHTVRAALRFLCCSVSDVPEELTAICELAKITASKIRQLTHRDSIHDVISEFVEERLPRIY